MQGGCPFWMSLIGHSDGHEGVIPQLETAVREISGRAQVRVRAQASTILPHTTFHHIYTFILCFDNVQSTSNIVAPSLDILLSHEVIMKLECIDLPITCVSCKLKFHSTNVVDLIHE